MLQRLGLKEGEAIIHPWVNKALEKAQQKVEARNFDIRKNLLKYDDVMNDQRKVVYEQRNELMRAADVSQTRHRTCATRSIDELVARCIPENAYAEQWDTKGLHEEACACFGLDLPSPSGPRKRASTDDEIAERITEAADRKMAEKAANYGPESHAHGREEHAAAAPRPDLEGPPAGARPSAPGHRPARLCPARSAERVQARGLRDVRGHAGRAARAGHGGSEPCRDPGAASPNGPSRSARSRAWSRAGRIRNGAGGRRRSPDRPAGPAPRSASPHRQMRRRIARRARVLRASRWDRRRRSTAGDPATWASVPRNAACPCGSGKKYKYCHGRLGEGARDPLPGPPPSPETLSPMLERTLRERRSRTRRIVSPDPCRPWRGTFRAAALKLTLPPCRSRPCSARSSASPSAATVSCRRRWAPPSGSGTISSMTPSRSRSCGGQLQRLGRLLAPPRRCARGSRRSLPARSPNRPRAPASARGWRRRARWRRPSRPRR